MRLKLVVKVLLVVAAGLGVFFYVVPPAVDIYYNRVAGDRRAAVPEPARRLHERLFVADLHADSLFWERDLLRRTTRGHVDLPRLIEGKVALQVFTVVTKVPRLGEVSDGADADLVTWFALAGRWPRATWGSLKQRALFQARRLEQTARGSSGRMVVVRTAADLARFVERRKAEPWLVGALLGVEGAHALEGDPRNVEEFADAGFRMIAPVHFFDTEFGGSASGVTKGGLTEAGREMIRRMEARGVLLDLAHASARTIDDACAVATRPVVVSHTGLRGACDSTRNIDDERARKVAATGGLIGIGYWPAVTCGPDAKSIARSIRYAANLVGVEHVALGSDFDGAVVTPFDAAGVAQVTAALMGEGFTEDEIRLIMGGNVLRVLAETLPR